MLKVAKLHEAILLQFMNFKLFVICIFFGWSPFHSHTAYPHSAHTHIRARWCVAVVVVMIVLALRMTLSSLPHYNLLMVSFYCILKCFIGMKIKLHNQMVQRLLRCFFSFHLELRWRRCVAGPSWDALIVCVHNVIERIHTDYRNEMERERKRRHKNHFINK